MLNNNYSHLVIIEEDITEKFQGINAVNQVNHQIRNGWKVLSIQCRNEKIIYIMGVPFPQFCRARSAHKRLGEWIIPYRKPIRKQWHHEGQRWACHTCDWIDAIEENKYFNEHGHLRNIPPWERS
jgi:hypothetical protein